MAKAGLILIVIFTVLGLPVWLSIAFGSTMALLDWGYGPEMIINTLYSKLASITLLAIPLFIFSGQLLSRSGVSEPMVEFSTRMMGGIPGGPAYAIIFVCVVFAAMSSSSLAALAGLSPIVLPMMQEMGYSRKFSLGLLMCGSALGPLIPPSIYLIIFAQITNQSASDLWIAAFLPGLLTAFLLAVSVFVYTRMGHYERPPSSTWAERGRSFRRAWPFMIMPIIVLVPIYIGWYTPEESAAVSVVFTLFLGFVVYKGLTLKKVWQSAVESAHLTSMVLIILAAAFLLNQAFTYQRIPFEIADWFSRAGFSALTFPLVAILLYTVMGMFLDANSILVIVGPMLLPVATGLGINPVAYSVFICLMVEIACLTPPFGMVLFAATGIVKEDFAFVSRSVSYFYPALAVAAFLIIYVPQISTFLGSLMD